MKFKRHAPATEFVCKCSLYWPLEYAEEIITTSNKFLKFSFFFFMTEHSERENW